MARVLLSKDGLKMGYQCALRLWCSEIQNHPAEFEAYVLVKVDHYKRKDRLFHEFLILLVRYGADLIMLRLERYAGDEKPPSAPLGKATDALSYVRISDDKITRVLSEFDPSPYFHITTALCDGAGLTLVDVCALCAELTPSDYSLPINNCYWFATTFLFMLAKRPVPGRAVVRVEPRAHASLGGKFMGMRVVPSTTSSSQSLSEAARTARARLKRVFNEVRLIAKATRAWTRSESTDDDPSTVPAAGKAPIITFVPATSGGRVGYLGNDIYQRGASSTETRSIATVSSVRTFVTALEEVETDGEGRALLTPVIVADRDFDVITYGVSLR